MSLECLEFATPTRPKPRGPAPLPKADKREHNVSIRFNDRELALLDSKCGPLTRAEWLRRAALEKVAQSVPELNVAAWVALENLAKELKFIFRRTDTDSIDVSDNHLNQHIAELLRAVALLRAQLVGAKR